MTGRDVELVAGAIAAVEAEVGRDHGNDVLELVVSAIASRIAAESPRFNRARFEHDALPWKAGRLQAAILASLRRSELERVTS